MIKTLKRDETGIALPVAMMMVVLISVMGAGLLVFATTDLTTAAEVNRGQQAFEMADAGIQVAREQLKDEPQPAKYNGGSDDVSWSYCFGIPAASCNDDNHADGERLNNLDGNPDTTDMAKVTILNCDISDSGCETLPEADTSFKVVSTGEYGQSRRRVEAIFKNTAPSSPNPVVTLQSWRECYDEDCGDP